MNIVLELIHYLNIVNICVKLFDNRSSSYRVNIVLLCPAFAALTLCVGALIVRSTNCLVIKTTHFTRMTITLLVLLLAQIYE